MSRHSHTHGDMSNLEREIYASVVGKAPATEGSAVFRPENLNTFDGYN